MFGINRVTLINKAIELKAYTEETLLNMINDYLLTEKITEDEYTQLHNLIASVDHADEV